MSIIRNKNASHGAIHTATTAVVDEEETLETLETLGRSRNSSCRKVGRHSSIISSSSSSLSTLPTRDVEQAKEAIHHLLSTTNHLQQQHDHGNKNIDSNIGNGKRINTSTEIDDNKDPELLDESFELDDENMNDDDDDECIPPCNDHSSQLEMCMKAITAIQKIHPIMTCKASFSPQTSTTKSTNSRRNTTTQQEDGVEKYNDDNDKNEKEKESDDHQFIRTSLRDYNNQTTSSSTNHHHHQSKSINFVRMLGLTHSSCSNLSSILAPLLSHRISNNTFHQQQQLTESNNNDDTNNDDDGNDNEFPIIDTTTTSIMDQSQTRLSPLSLVATRLYLHFLSLNIWKSSDDTNNDTMNSYGSFMDMTLMSHLASVVRQWSDLCRHEDWGGLLLLNGKGVTTTGGGGGGGGQKGRKNQSSSGSGSGSGSSSSHARRRKSKQSQSLTSRAKHLLEDRSGPKRRRRNYSEEGQEDVTNDEYSDGDNDNAKSSRCRRKEDEEEEQSNCILLEEGLHLSSSLAQILACTELFSSWSSDVREVIIEASILSFGTITGLASSLSADQRRNGQGLVGLLQSVKSQIEDALQQQLVYDSKCYIEETNRYINPNGSSVRRSVRIQRSLAAARVANENISSSMDTTIFILRRFYPLATLQVHLPNGAKGRVAAYEIITSIIENTISSVSTQLAKVKDSAYFSATRSVSRSTQRQHGPTSTTTPHIGLQRRYSITFSTKKTPKRTPIQGTVNSEGTIIPVPPSLKKCFTPTSVVMSQQRQSQNNRQQQQHQQSSEPHYSLRPILGFLQKIGTHKGLDKADNRNKASSFLLRCLAVLPHTQQCHLLHFTTQLCQSKIAFHRVFGLEIIGEILVTDWIWSSEYATTTRRSSTPTNDYNHGITNATTPMTQQRNIFERGTHDTADQEEEEDDDDDEVKSLPEQMWIVVKDRLVDRVPPVRTRAAQSIGNIVEIFKTNSITPTTTINEKHRKRFASCIIPTWVELTSALRKRASSDVKPGVRRASILALVKMFHLGSLSSELATITLPTDSDISILVSLCSDSAVSVRSAAAEGLESFLLKHQKIIQDSGESHSSMELFESAWVDGVLPLVLDLEPSSVTNAVRSFSTLVINPILEELEENGDSLMTSSSSCRMRSSWNILSNICDVTSSAGSAKGTYKAMTTALTKMIQKESCGEVYTSLLNKLFRVAINSITSGQDAETNSDQEYRGRSEDATREQIGVWFLLDALVTVQDQCTLGKGPSKSFHMVMKRSKISFQSLLLSWKVASSTLEDYQYKDYSNMRSVARHCLHLISKLCILAKDDELDSMIASLKSMLQSLVLDQDLIGDTISTTLVLIVKTSKDDRITSCTEWINQVLHQCEKELGKSLSEQRQSESSSNIDRIERIMFTVGEISVVGMSSIEYFPESMKDPTRKGITQKDVERMGMNPPQGLLNHIHSLILPTLPNAPSWSKPETKVNHTLRANAYLALGKLCLFNEEFAKVHVNLFAKELRPNEPPKFPAIQSNSLLILGDLCVRYTHMVDKFLPLMSSCLQANIVKDNKGDLDDSNPEAYVVRQHAVLLLSNLLLQDYAKWKGELFHRFVVATVDQSSVVSELAKMALCGPLKTKHPHLFFDNFLDAIFVVNGCKVHPINGSIQSPTASNRSLFGGLNISGEKGQEKRQEIYAMLLDHMSDEEKIGITARIAKDIFGAAIGASDDHLSTYSTISDFFTAQSLSSSDTTSRHILSDCFSILTSRNIRVNKQKGDQEDMDTSISNIASSGQISTAKSRLLSKISSKHLIESMFPILCSMKLVLEQNKSPLLKDLMEYLVQIYRQHKQLVSDVLVTNQTLLQEISYESRSQRRS